MSELTVSTDVSVITAGQRALNAIEHFEWQRLQPKSWSNDLITESISDFYR